MGDTLGRMFRVTSFGESHGRCVGVVVEGCPAGLRLQEQDIQRELDRRKPGKNNLSTGRVEEDRVEIMSGVFNGYTTGAPICMLVWNKDVGSTEYERIRSTPRPGHADLTAPIRYGGFNDYRGSGRFSGRITAGFVMAGALAKQLLGQLEIVVAAHTVEVAGIRARKRNLAEIMENASRDPLGCADPDASVRMMVAIRRAAQEGDSVGGVIECIAVNVPPGVGDPVFDTLEGDIAKALFAIPGTKAAEFGSGFSGSRMKGSENNDPFTVMNGKIVAQTNNAGGILGGLSTGMPIVCRAAVKPTASISKPQKTVDLSEMKDTYVETRGRHDPCIVPRAIPVVESVVAVILADHLIRSGHIERVLKVNR